jgi:SAM-dependent methyltransferase
MTSICPVCSGTDTELYLDDQVRTISSESMGSSRTRVCHGRILRCASCRLGFSELRPSGEALANLYASLDNKTYENEQRARVRTAARHLRIVERYAGPGRLLDVGCASGMFLRAAASKGWAVVGVEPSRVFFESARQNLSGCGEVFCTVLQKADLPPSSFDVITLWDVLEHITEPVNFLRVCERLLKPGGLLFVNVPDIESIQARLFGPRWPLLLQEHLNYFTRESLRQCSVSAGLEWIAHGRRPVSFSVGYVLYRLQQHRFPLAEIGRSIAAWMHLTGAVLTVPLGEIYGVSRKPHGASRPCTP